MKNLVPYNKNCIAVYDQALARKRDEDLKTRLSGIYENMKSAYVLYNNAFDINNLQTLNPGLHFQPHNSDLRSLYKYSSFTIRQFKKHIDGIQPFFLGNVCQNCTINSVNTMDHVLGQEEFPEYCVHPYNLFPSCTECNGYKSDSFVRNGTRLFLNLYADQLPGVQYLFLKVFKNKNDDLDYSFFLENRHGINMDFFTLIQNHYYELQLLDRMKLYSIKSYSELRNSITSRIYDVSWDQIVQQIKREAEANKGNLGLNHFQYVLQSEMIDSQLFYDSFMHNPHFPKGSE